MRLPPLLASLTRHKLTVALMLLSAAFTCAIVCNLAAMIVHRLALLNAPSGLDESSVIAVDSSRIDATSFGADDKNEAPEYSGDVAALRDIAGVESAAAVSGLPFEGGMGIDASAKADTAQGQTFQVTGFPGGPGELATLGLHLVRGRDFLATEYVFADDNGINKVSAAIVSRALANRLFHGAEAVGQLLYQDGHPIRIVGVVEHLMGMSPQLGAVDNEYAMLLPLKPSRDYATFVLRVSPGDRDRLLRQAIAVLNTRDSQRVLDNAKSFTQIRAEYFRRETAMVGLLLAAALALLAVTAAGIAGLANFWVQQRTHSIGIRRAVGATKADILRYFHSENFLIVSGGILLGCALAYALNLMLMKYYALRVLPPVYLLIGALTLWSIGQLAVIGPALRAARVPPAVATRSV